MCSMQWYQDTEYGRELMTTCDLSTPYLSGGLLLWGLCIMAHCIAELVHVL